MSEFAHKNVGSWSIAPQRTGTKEGYSVSGRHR